MVSPWFKAHFAAAAAEGRSGTIRLIGSFLAGALLSGAVLTFAIENPQSKPALTGHHAKTVSAYSYVRTGQPRLDVLRDEAALGDGISSRELTDALLNRYDLTGDLDDLFEAVVWMDQRWAAAGDASGDISQIQRVAVSYCGHPVVRWHWICLPGE
ncbi:hypothetical protein QTH90_30960 [Variovorax sp. J2P1-59]|uniref:hypothetical protein n=1 Tax=Variovorax flavidus TaxID=3053501 RepID=UPI0025754FAA|nr:hypothetical protein [Variovorax sp. J2P1-59]MDM0078862.1 hypothetical protein [Variovorax sp. J2P1-59]